MPHPAATSANEILADLIAGEDFVLPVVDLSGPEFTFPYDADSPLYGSIDRLTNEDLTQRMVGGSGAFDALMDGFKAHLTQEYENNRITGAEYTKAYIALTQAAMQNATTFLLGREQTIWASINAQLQALTARAQLEIEKVKLHTARMEANTVKANYALTKLKLATEEVTIQTAEFSLANLMPMQLTMLTEQAQVQRAQTLDTRLDGVTVVTGTVGKQKELYSQQITSYQRDAEVKAAKIFADAYITHKTIDEGLTSPNVFTNAGIDEVMGILKTNAGLDNTP